MYGSCLIVPGNETFTSCRVHYKPFICIYEYVNPTPKCKFLLQTWN